jgi:iron complex outermembrane receptor protein
LLCSRAAQAQSRPFDIPAEDAGRSIPELARQAGIQIIAPGQALHGLVTPAIKGLFEVKDALAEMLYGSRLSVASDDGHTIVLAIAAATAVTPDDSVLPLQIEPIEQVVVTGSRIISDASRSPTPVVTFWPDQLLATTPSNVADALNKLPIFQGSSSQRTGSSASGNFGGDYLNLRNFGAQRTLVLLGGNRYTPSNANGSVDVSTLPQMLFTRVDVVTGGASAVYGSDAITGVVNFVLDKNFDGVKYEANGGISDYGDGASYKAGIAAGKSLFGGRGHIEGSLQYEHADGVYKEHRPGGSANYASYGLGTAASPFINIQQGRLNTESFGGKIACASCAANGQQFIANDKIGPFDAGTVPVAGGSVSIGGDGVYVHNTQAIAATKDAEAFARFSYNLSDDTTFWLQGSATQASVFNWFFPSQIDNGRQTTAFFTNNPYLSADQQTVLCSHPLAGGGCAATDTFNIQKWLDNQPGRATNSVTRNLNLSTGFNGQLLGKYDWDFHYTHGESRDSITGVNNGNNQYLDASRDAVVDTDGTVKCYNDTAAAIAQFGNLYPGCVPINAFGPTSITDAAYHYWSRNTEAALTNTLDDVTGSVSGDIFDLPAGPVKVALSGEMRWLGYNVKSNASPTALVNCKGLRLCGNGTDTQALWDNNTLANVNANQNVWEFAAEAGLPVIKDVPLVQSFNIDVAGRYTDYSDSGAVQTWKIGLDWHVNGDIRFRGTTSIDIRAPTLNDLYSPTTFSSAGFFDLLTNFAGTGTQIVTQGNPNLVPEVARTYTAGIVLTPRWIPNLTASADFYNINLRNAITTTNATNTQIQALCNNSGGSSRFCTLYQRPIPFGQPGFNTPANYPTGVFSQNLNAAFQATEGEDYEVDYHFNMADIVDSLLGGVSLRALLNVSPKIDSIQFPGANRTYTGNPKGHATLFADYTLGNYSLKAEWHYCSGANKNTLAVNPQIYSDPRVGSFNTVDITVSRDLHFDDNAIGQVYLSVQNIANANPPIAIGDSGNPGFGIPVVGNEDYMGRYFTIGVRGNF